MFIHYPDAVVGKLKGKHAASYLQNRLSNDLKLLSPQHSAVEAAALSPQGKIAVVLFVTAIAADEFLFVADGGERVKILQDLMQFKVAERADLTDLSQLTGLIHCDDLGTDQLQAVLPDNTTYIPAPRFSPSGMHCLVPIETLQTCLAALKLRTFQLADAALFAARFKKNLLSFPEELNDQLLLAEANRNDLVSLTKGCYVGQEVVAKIEALGRAPRIVMRFTTDAEVSNTLHASIVVQENPTRSIGKVLSACIDPATSKTIGFCVLRNDPAIIAGRLVLAEGGKTLVLVKN